MTYIIRFFFTLAFAFVFAGCASFSHHDYTPLNKSVAYYDYLQPTYGDYLKSTQTWLTENRAYISEEREKEIAMNMPFELSPEQPTNKAIMLVHGLGDSPYSFSDLAATFQAQGFHVQALLLPGHGSKPEDLMLPDYRDWQTIVDHYADQLKENYDEVWLGGFSTGANLVTIHSVEQGGIDGLVLVSPGFQSKAPVLEKFAPLAALFTDGYEATENNLARYNSAPLRGAIAYSKSAETLRGLLKTNKVTTPTIMVLSEADSVVDPIAVKALFDQRFEHQRNTLVWYGESVTNSESVKAQTMQLAQQKISTASHMSPLFAPTNPYYGENGEKRMCMNSFSDEANTRCENGEEVWFSAWGYEESGKIHARLTWNPYFEDLHDTIQAVSR